MHPNDYACGNISVCSVTGLNRDKILCHNSFRITTLVILAGILNCPQTSALAQNPDEPLEPPVEAAEDPKICKIVASPAKEPQMADRYKLYPHRRDLKPGAAYTHFTRALLQFFETGELVRQQWNQFQELHEAGKAETEIDEALMPFEAVFAEIENFGKCEDLTWDERLRDLTGKQLADTLMPEMQHARELAKLIRFKCLMHLQKHEFDGAFECICTGYRLAEFLGQGESIVQQLVGIAVCSLMEDCIRKAISTPGCPNLYWAIASIPKPLVSCRKSIELELTGLASYLPILAEAETLSLSAEQWGERWQKDIRVFDTLFAPQQPEDGVTLASAFAWTKENGIAEAKKCLVTNGKTLREIQSMPVEQLIALSSLYEIRKLSSDLAKGFTLPMSIRSEVLKAHQLELEAYTAEHPKSIASVVMNLAAPSVEGVGQAESRSVYFLHRLMNVEALRMHLAVHGELPDALSDMHLAPAMPNPFDGSEFTYDVKEEANGWTVTLDCKTAPSPPFWFWPIKLEISKEK